jgi:predicted NBD/HSP70 family sugar kinase
MAVPSDATRQNAAGPRVLEALLTHGARRLSLGSLAAAAGVSRRSMTDVARRLSDAGVITREPVAFGRESGLVLAVAVGSENVRAGLVDVNGDILLSNALAPEIDQMSHSPGDMLGRIRAAALPVLEEAVENWGSIPLLGAIAALPTPVGRDGYAHGYAFADKEWYTVPLKDRVASGLGGPFLQGTAVDVVNDANAGVMAIGFELARQRAEGPPGPHSEIIMTVRLGGGIGAGTLQLAPYRLGEHFALTRSHLVVGSHGYAGELGHLPINGVWRAINEDRPANLAPLADWECSCRQRGHLEGMAGVHALKRRLSQSGYKIDADEAVGPQLDRLLANPDDRVQRALHDTGRLLGRALASPILMLDPQSITLTGYLARDAVAGGITREQHLWSAGVSNTVSIGVLSGFMSDYVEVRGAALMMLRRRRFARLASLDDPARRDRDLTRFDRSHLDAMR